MQTVANELSVHEMEIAVSYVTQSYRGYIYGWEAHLRNFIRAKGYS